MKRINPEELLHDSPIIAAVKNDCELQKSIDSDCTVIFVLYGTILTLPDIVARIAQAGKYAFVHIDLIEGLSVRRDVAAEYIYEKTQATGAISTRSVVLRRAKELGLITVQRFFLLDSLAFDNIVRQASEADVVDILPGTMPKIISRLSKKVRQPIIASGLISDKEDIIAALSAGATAISTTDSDLWFA